MKNGFPITICAADNYIFTVVAAWGIVIFVPPFFFNGCHDEHATSVVVVVEFVVDDAAVVIVAVDESASAVVTVDCFSEPIIIDVSGVAVKLSSN